MTPAQTAELLALCAAYDGRKVAKLDVAAWHSAIGDLGFEDAKQAVVAHYRGKREWIMPADVFAAVKAIRAARLDKAPTMTALMDDVDPSDPHWAHIYRTRRAAIADGQPPLKAVGS